MATAVVHGGTPPLAAITAVFTPPCPTTWLITGTRLPSQLPMFPRSGPASCDPPAWSRNLEGGGFQYYSPAICPQGFAVGPSCGLTKARTTEGFPSVVPGENVAYCVPIGMSCTTDMTDFRGGVWGFATAPNAAVTVGPAMQIRWRDADLEILETHPLSPGLRRQVVATNVVPTGPSQTADVFSPTIRTIITAIPVPTSNPSTTTPGGSNQTSEAAGSTKGGGSTAPMDTNTMAFVIVILVVLAVAMLGILGLILFRKHRAGKLKGLPNSIMDWAMSRWARNRNVGDEKEYFAAEIEIAGAELGRPEALPPELEYGPARGSVMNPAELDGWGVGQRPRRWSGVPQRPRRPSDAASPFAVNRLSTVEESPVEKSTAPPIPPKAPTRPRASHVRSTSRSLTVSYPKPLPVVPVQSPRPASIGGGLVSPLSPPESPIFGNQTRVYSTWKKSEG